jgi:hypothetical protein
VLLCAASLPAAAVAAGTNLVANAGKAGAAAATNALARTGTPEEAREDLNANLVRKDGTPIGVRISVGLVPDYAKSESVRPWMAAVLREDQISMNAFALTEGEHKGAVVGYLDDATLMVRDLDGKRLGKVFTPRSPEKFRNAYKRNADDEEVVTPTYDGRPLTEIEAYVFRLAGWQPAN